LICECGDAQFQEWRYITRTHQLIPQELNALVDIFSEQSSGRIFRLHVDVVTEEVLEIMSEEVDVPRLRI
jgi:hypothetical protein